MQKSWESYIDVGIVLPKLFSGIADDKERFSQGLMTILKDPFFTTVEVSYTPDPEIVEMTGEYARLAGAQVVFNGGDAVRRLGTKQPGGREKESLCGIRKTADRPVLPGKCKDYARGNRKVYHGRRKRRYAGGI